jgi:opine dehydrogenase
MTSPQRQGKDLIWAIIGGGNGGQSLAAHLAIMGFPVRLYDVIPETIAAINAQGGVHVDGVVQGFGQLDLATMDIAEAVKGADIVMVVAPALAHRAIAKNCAPWLSDGQLIFIHPGATAGALEFNNVLHEEGCQAAVTVAEANSLLYACRSAKPGHCSIFGIKNKLMVAALPASENDKVVEKLNNAFPQIHAGKNVLHTSLENPNAMMHPAPTLLNTSLIESKWDWLYYYDGITPSIGAFVEELDKERIAVGAALGLEITPIIQWYAEVYDAVGDTLSEAVRNNKAYAGVKGQKTIRTRYVLEDIPMGLVPLASLGQKLGLPMSRSEAIIRLGELFLKEDFSKSGRTLENLGLSDMNAQQIIRFVETGSR